MTTCDVHANLFESFHRLCAEEKKKVKTNDKRTTNPEIRNVNNDKRHGMFFLLLSSRESKTKEQVDGKRDVYHLTKTNSPRSVERFYQLYQDMLAKSCENCEQSFHQGVWRHKTYGVTSNFTRRNEISTECQRLTSQNFIRYEFINESTISVNDSIELSRCERYFTVTIEIPCIRVLSLLNFAFFNGMECWSFWNHTVLLAIKCYNTFGLYPINDSLVSISVVLLNNGENVFVHDRGITTKLGTLTEFAQSLQFLMKICVVSCCYAINRRSTVRNNYNAKHRCWFPAKTNGIYNELFTTTRYGHDLLCNNKIQTYKDSVKWLKLYEVTQKQSNLDQKQMTNNVIHDHVSMLENTYANESVQSY